MRNRGPPTVFIYINSINFYYIRLRVYLTLRFLATRNITHPHRFAEYFVRIALDRGCFCDMSQHAQTCFIVLFSGNY